MNHGLNILLVFQLTTTSTSLLRLQQLEPESYKVLDIIFVPFTVHMINRQYLHYCTFNKSKNLVRPRKIECGLGL